MSDNDRESSDCVLLSFSRIRFVNRPTACRDHEAIVALLPLSRFSSFFLIKLDEEEKSIALKNPRERKRLKKHCHRREEKKKEKMVTEKNQKDLFYSKKMHIYTLYDRNKFESSFFSKKNERKSENEGSLVYIHLFEYDLLDFVMV